MPNRLPLVTTDGLIQQVQASDNLKVPGFLALGTLTQAEIDALTPSNGVTVYNETNKQFESFENGIWITKLNVISTARDFFVATTGSDSTGSGSAENPWATIDKALSYLANFVILAKVTIYIAAGDYTSTSSTLIINHPNGDKIYILGDYSTETITFSSVSGSSGNYNYIMTNSLLNPGYIDNDYVLIYGSASTASNEQRVHGVLKVVSHTANTVTLNTIDATVASGGTFYVSLPRVKFARPILITHPLASITGIQNLYNVSGTYDNFIQIDQVLVGLVTFNHCIFMNTNASQHGWNRNYLGTSVQLNYCGMRNFLGGWFCGSAAALALNNSGSTYCTYGIWSYGRGVVQLVYVHMTRNTIALYADFMSVIFLGGGAVLFSNNGTLSSPASGADGNHNSYINY